MVIVKEKRKVLIALRDDILLRGFVEINPGERIFDFINDAQESFIAVSDVEVFYPKRIKSFLLPSRSVERKKTIVVIKSAILWIEEIE